MRIDINNTSILSTKGITLHDDYFLNFNYFDSSNTITVNMLSRDHNNFYTIEFVNVIGFKMSTCSFWGSTPHVYWFGYSNLNEQTIIPELKKIYKENPNFHNPFENKEYIEIELILSSSNTLTIACEFINLNKNEMS